LNGGGLPFNQPTTNSSSSFIIGSNGLGENIAYQPSPPTLPPPLPINPSTTNITLMPIATEQLQSQTTTTTTMSSTQPTPITILQQQSPNETIQNCTNNSQMIINNQITLNTSFYTTSASSNTSSANNATIVSPSISVPVLVQSVTATTTTTTTTAPSASPPSVPTSPIIQGTVGSTAVAAVGAGATSMSL